ncbi:Xaa-Pro aminopeptidase [Halogranum gelatinilyticum]|uniref:Xaa-Pro aminopeptidase n=1 Tax=Halogranum gelatinilyticum TaxID=660521 RepID=A0A1G9Q0J7_9EURY|nr:M24 family metallopeptidase [Halogranum gelatinilyticum]SDM03845.1 Xaa-Pro aminopeptidase [Halogranum gelatinilyticum]
MAPEPDPDDGARVDRLAAALDAADADAFVHVGDATDADLRYLTRLSETPHEYGFVYADGEATLLAPPELDTDDDAAAAFSGRIEESQASDPMGSRVVDCLTDRLDGRADDATVLVPRHLPHDAAVYLEQAGYGLESTPVVGEARAVKSDWERDRLRAVQRAAVRGMQRARTILSAATVEDGVLHWKDAPLSAERLRRQVNATLVAEGVVDVSGTRIRVANGGEAGGLPASDPIVVTVEPRGADGYYGLLTRTVVVDSDGGWERRAHVGVEAARRVALGELEPGAALRWVHSETVAEAGSFGLGAPEGDRVHGVGLSRREEPSLADEAAVGTVVAVKPCAVDEKGRVALADLAVVTEEGCELLVDASTSLSP